MFRGCLAETKQFQLFWNSFETVLFQFHFTCAGSFTFAGTSALSFSGLNIKVLRRLWLSLLPHGLVNGLRRTKRIWVCPSHCTAVVLVAARQIKPRDWFRGFATWKPLHFAKNGLNMECWWNIATECTVRRIKDTPLPYSSDFSILHEVLVEITTLRQQQHQSRLWAFNCKMRN